MATSAVEEFLRASNRTHAIRGPPAFSAGATSSLGTTDGSYQAPEPFQLGEVVHVPQLWAQTYTDANEQGTATNLLGDDHWNSWNEDPVEQITASVSGMTWATLNTAVAVNTYYVEYWYADKTQTLLAAPDANGYQIGDCESEPQDIFDQIEMINGTFFDAPFSVKGFKVGTPIPSVSYFYKFKAYLGRVTYVMKDATGNRRVKYFLNFVPLSTTEKGFAKILAKTEKTPFIDLDNSTLLTYDSNYNQACLEPEILTSEWAQTDNVTDSLRIVLKSKHVIHNAETQFTNLPHGATIEASQTLTLDPNIWEDTDNPYYTFGIASPQATLECWVSHLSYGKIQIVYRAMVRGWVVRTTDGTVASNSDLYIYQLAPPATSGGSYTFVKLLGISSTTSSSPGVAGITYQAANGLNFYRQVITKDGKDVPPTVLANIPEYITLQTDTTSDLIGSLIVPNSQFHMKVKPFYVDTASTKVYGKLLTTLIQNGTFRWSPDEGKSWGAWQTVGQTTPYIDSNDYLGTGALSLYPGFQSSIGEVSSNTFLQPGEYLTAASVDTKKLSNDFIDISFDLT